MLKVPKDSLIVPVDTPLYSQRERERENLKTWGRVGVLKCIWGRNSLGGCNNPLGQMFQKLLFRTKERSEKLSWAGKISVYCAKLWSWL